MPKVIGVRFHGVGKAFDFDPGTLKIESGDALIVETAKGIEFGIAANSGREKRPDQLFGELKPVLRKATPEDLQAYEENRVKAREAYVICRDRIEAHELDMNLVDVELTFDRQKIIFYFISENRVDFRALVKDLAMTFHRRIELRQIGVRDEARMTGGVGICGRTFCCATFLNDFVPVSVKMAKYQNLSMNPSKISGCCGRLMCCLKYEQEAYEEARKIAPKQGAILRTPRGEGRVQAVDLLRERAAVVIRGEAGEELLHFDFSELAEARSSAGEAGSAQPGRAPAQNSGQARRPFSQRPSVPLAEGDESAAAAKHNCQNCPCSSSAPERGEAVPEREGTATRSKRSSRGRRAGRNKERTASERRPGAAEGSRRINTKDAD